MSNDFFQIYALLKSGNIFPTDLAQLGLPVNSEMLSPGDSNLFVCPGTGSRSGPMSEVDEWSDYIYIGNPDAESLLNVALLISPPENHGGDYGYVLFSLGNISQLPAKEIRHLIADPFYLATNESPENISSAKLTTTIRIPERLQPYYPPGTFYTNASTSSP